MAAVTYRQVAAGDAAALYESAAVAGAAMSYVLLAVPRETAPGTVEFATAWKYPSAYLFATTPLTIAPDALAQAIWRGTPSPNARGAGWVANSATGRLAFGLLRMTWMTDDTGQVGGSPDIAVPFGNVALSLPAQAAVQVGESGLTVTDDGILLQRSDGTGQAPLVPDGGTVALSGADGRIGFGATWDTYSLYTLFRADPFSTAAPRGAEIRYTWDDGTAGPKQLCYPVLPPAAAGGPGDVTLRLDASLDPLAVNDGTRTRLRIVAGQQLSALSASYAATVAGVPVTLTPLAAGEDLAGYWLARSPDVAGAPAVHLAPLGPFAIGVTGGGTARLMCGVSGLEYLQVADGDVLDFTPNGAAFAPGFGVAAPSGDQPVLDETFTTAWVAYRPHGTGRAYFAQPGASVSFGTGVVPAQRSGPMDLPAAVASLVRPVTSETAAFPLVPYGGLTLPADVPQPPAAVVTSFERQVLSGVRGARLRIAASQSLAAEATPPDPVFAGANGTPLDGGRTATPQGLLVDLNGKTGTWHQVLLARSGSRYLSFDADPVTKTVDATLATTLLREQLCLVVSNWDRFPPGRISRALSVAGFEVEFAPDAGAPDRATTVMVFKYATAQPLRDLVATPGAWAEAGYFVGDDAAQAKTCATLKAAIAVADATKGQPGDPFAYFRDVVAGRPEWTGLLTFNAPINGNGMPADLQMLFAGIDGPLSAHHMGVEVNRIAPGATPDIAESSLFGVVHYPPAKPPAPQPVPDPPPPFGFAVQQLDVAIRNSRVVDFHARVGITVNELFGRAVTLVPPVDSKTNTISIAGAYQDHGGVGTVTFEAAEASDLAFNPDGTLVRVLDRFVVTGASLVPVSSTPSQDGGTDVVSRITLGGALGFAADPFPGVKGLDLFSYDGLPLAGLALGITFHLDAAGVRVGSATIAPDLSGVVASDNRAAVRRGSVVDLLPLSVSGFVQAPAGLDPAKVGGLPVDVLQISGTPGYTTTTPRYAVQYKLPLGSLGALSDAHASLDAYLVVGWGPSVFTPDDDGAALYVQLPQISAGAFGFDLQGLLKTTFGDANLMLVDLPAPMGPVYVLLFNNVALSVLGFTFPPQVITDFVVFADPAKQSSALGWSLAATQVGT